MKSLKRLLLVSALLLPSGFSFVMAQSRENAADASKLWELVTAKRNVHRFSTLFTAQDVRKQFSTQEGLQEALDWCRTNGVTKVYIETFRGGYQAERAVLAAAKARFLAAGIEPSGCITTTGVGKPVSGSRVTSCYTDRPTQDKLQAIFEYAAGLFDEIMIDDFWFTDCACAECDKARRARKVVVGDRTYPVSGDTWADYRSELLVHLSRARMLGPAKRVNPKVRLIIKYPLWHELFQERGYDVVRETADFDRTWVGTEIADRVAPWKVQYGAYFIMRWLGAIGGPKCGGGWFDTFQATEPTYVEQARQTVLGGARESMLFCWGSLHRDTGPRNVEALRASIPDLLAMAGQVSRREIAGIAAYKPPNSTGQDVGPSPGTMRQISAPPQAELYVFDYLGMLGIPLAPCSEFPARAPAAAFALHALKDAGFLSKLSRFIASGRPVLLTDGLAQRLNGKVKLDGPNVHVLPVRGDPVSLLKMSQDEVESLRAPLLRPFKVAFRAPNKVGLYLFKDGSTVVENFNDEPAPVELNGARLTVPARGWLPQWK